MKPHAQLWYKPDGTFFLPRGTAAVLRMGMDRLNKGWFPTNVEITTITTMGFRYEQAVDYMNRIRVMPAVLAVTIHENPYTSSSEYEWGAVKRLQWHGHIDWFAVRRIVLEQLRSEYPLIVCGYDGKENPC